MISTKECVARGAQALDQVAPGWAAAIDLKKLDIRSGLTCILGQVVTARRAADETVNASFDSLWRAVRTVEKRIFYLHQGGFMPTVRKKKTVLFFFRVSRNNHAELKKAWRREVGTRLSANGNEPLAA